MTDTKISALADGGILQSGDLLIAARSGTNYKITTSGGAWRLANELKIYDQYGNVLRDFGPLVGGPPALARLTSVWKTGLDNSTLVIVGDSVTVLGPLISPPAGGSGYVSLLLTQIAAAYPNMNITANLWDDTSQSYPGGANTKTFQSGKSGPTLTVYIFAVAGKAYDYFINQTRLETGLTSVAPDAVIVTLGKNEAANTATQSGWRMRALLAQIQYRAPSAELAELIYNPNTTGASNPNRVDELRQEFLQTARLLGCDVIDAMQAIENTGNVAALTNVDGVHPTTGTGNTGSQLIADVVMQALRYEPSSAPRTHVPPVASLRSPSALLNSDLQEWSGNGFTQPFQWSLVNVTASQDTTHVDEELAGSFNMQATAAALSTYAYQDAPAWFLNAAKGGTVTLTAQVYIPAGQVASNGVIALDDGTTTSTWQWVSTDAANGNWCFISVTLKVSSSATRIRAYLYGDNAAGAATGACNVSWGKVWLGVGALPKRALVPEHVSGRRFVTFGGRVMKRTGVTGSTIYNAGATDEYIAFRGAAVRECNLPDVTVVPSGTMYLFLDEDGNGAVGQERKITPQSGQTIDGSSATRVINTPRGMLRVVSGVGAWHIIDAYPVAAASTLSPGRNIDGQLFDGSADVTVVAPATHAATGKSTPVDADELPLVDSAASNVLKKLTWANLKATLKNYFDPLYVAQSIGTTAGDLITFSGSATPVRLAIGATAGRAVVADPSATNKVSVNNPLSLNDANVGTTGALLASYDRRWVTSIANAGAATSGTLRLWLIPLPSGLTITTLTFWAGTTAGASLTHSWAAIFDASRNKLSASNDNTSATWTASTSRAFTFGTPYLVPSSGVYYVGILIAGTTIPTIEGVSVLTAGARNTAPLPGGNTTDTGLTTPATCPNPAGSITVLGQYSYFEIS